MLKAFVSLAPFVSLCSMPFILLAVFYVCLPIGKHSKRVQKRKLMPFFTGKQALEVTLLDGKRYFIANDNNYFRFIPLRDILNGKRTGLHR